MVRALCDDGATTGILADRLFVTEETVKSHLQAVMSRVGVHSRTELAVLALRGRVVLNAPDGPVTFDSPVEVR